MNLHADMDNTVSGIDQSVSSLGVTIIPSFLAVAMAPEVHPFTAAAQSIEEQDGWTGVLE